MITNTQVDVNYDFVFKWNIFELLLELIASLVLDGCFSIEIGVIIPLKNIPSVEYIGNSAAAEFRELANQNISTKVDNRLQLSAFFICINFNITFWHVLL